MKFIPTFVLFASCILIACMGWLFIPTQVQSLSPLLAVTLRFTIGSLFLFAWLFITRHQFTRHLSFRAQLLIGVNGFISFFLNYILAYHAFYSLPSGIIAVALSGLIIPNLIFERIFFKSQIKFNMALGSLISIIGLFLLFIKDIKTFQFHTYNELLALTMVLASTLFTSLGTILIKKLMLKGYSTLPILTYSMSWGSFFGIIACLYQGLFIKQFAIIQSQWLSLMYVGFFVSGLGFLIFFEMVQLCGPTRASYVWVAAPVGSLILSIILENFHLTFSVFLGVFFTILGALIFNKDSKILNFKLYINRPTSLTSK